MSEAGAPGLSGSVRLRCASSPERGTYLAQQSFAAPMHISKAYWDGEFLLVHLVNPTAGVFGGDRVQTHVTVETGACVLLSTPSATRFHPSRGRLAQLDQVFDIRAGSFLDVFPEISIPQRGSRSRQTTIIDVKPGGELIYLETLTPGRVASGESSFSTNMPGQLTSGLADDSSCANAPRSARATKAPPDYALFSPPATMPAS